MADTPVTLDVLGERVANLSRQFDALTRALDTHATTYVHVAVWEQRNLAFEAELRAKGTEIADLRKDFDTRVAEAQARRPVWTNVAAVVIGGAGWVFAVVELATR